MKRKTKYTDEAERTTEFYFEHFKRNGVAAVRTKLCPECKLILKADKFGFDKSQQDGLSRVCMDHLRLYKQRTKANRAAKLLTDEEINQTEIIKLDNEETPIETIFPPQAIDMIAQLLRTTNQVLEMNKKILHYVGEINREGKCKAS